MGRFIVALLEGESGDGTETRAAPALCLRRMRPGLPMKTRALA
jgi:hypothetical protein